VPAAPYSPRYRMFKRVLAPLVWFYTRPKVEGLERVPLDGGAILAPNHLAEIDSLALALVIPRQLTFFAKGAYFTAKGPFGRLVAWILTSAEQIRVDRGGGEAAAQALVEGAKILDAGGLLTVYPEGTRSPDGRLHRGRTGLMRVALPRDCPLLPVTITRTDKIKLWRPVRVRIVFGEPLDLSPYGRDPDDRDAVRAATDVLMETLQRQGGQEYVDTYARRRQSEH
jgi:1-acyl-sn-glycerol-3-phosphate acyltransferase